MLGSTRQCVDANPSAIVGTGTRARRTEASELSRRTFFSHIVVSGSVLSSISGDAMASTCEAPKLEQIPGFIKMKLDCAKKGARIDLPGRVKVIITL